MLTQSRLTEIRNLAAADGPAFILHGRELVDMCDELMRHRDERAKLQDENESLRHDLRQATADPRVSDIEALAQRLAKVEDNLDYAKTLTRTKAKELTARIDQVCDTIGARIGGLEERLARLEQAPERFVLHDNVKVTNAPFPTGAGTTVEDAVAVAEAEAWTAAVAQVEEPGAESEPLKPQRGDRVRLEGARSIGGAELEDRWFDVLGQNAGIFQVESGGGLFWVMLSDPGLKEVRRGAANLSA